MWPPNTNGNISLVMVDMFVNKIYWSEMTIDYAIEDGFSLRRIKNDMLRHITMCKSLECTLKIKLVERKYYRAKLNRNSMVSDSWIAKPLYRDHKVRPKIEVIDLQSLLMKR